MDKRDKLRAEIKGLLGDDEKRVSLPDRVIMKGTIKVPEPHATNAICCPQCDDWTWNHLSECIHCHFDQATYFQNRKLSFVKISYQRKSKRYGAVSLMLFVVAAYFFMSSKLELFAFTTAMMVLTGFMFTYLWDKNEKIEVFQSNNYDM